MTMARMTKPCRRDFSWKFTPVIIEWERGSFGDELVEVSHEQAEKIIEYFRGRWGAGSRLELDRWLLGCCPGDGRAGWSA